MRITRVYTRTGDQGETGLGGGQRVPKDHPRIEAYGAVDELNSILGVARAVVEDRRIDGQLEAIQHQLFDLGGDLCLLEPDKRRLGVPPFPEVHVQWMERLLDAANAELTPLREFVLPGGHAAAGHLHVARCVARRAERLCVGLARTEPVSPQVVPYLNRLSDALFQLARLVNLRSGKGDVLWQRKRERGDAPAPGVEATPGEAPSGAPAPGEPGERGPA